MCVCVCVCVCVCCMQSLKLPLRYSLSYHNLTMSDFDLTFKMNSIVQEYSWSDDLSDQIDFGHVKLCTCTEKLLSA